VTFRVKTFLWSVIIHKITVDLYVDIQVNALVNFRVIISIPACVRTTRAIVRNLSKQKQRLQV